MVRDVVRVVGIVIIALELAFLISFLTVAYGSLTTLEATLQQGQPLRVEMDVDPLTRDRVVTFSMSVENRGFFVVYVGLDLKVLTMLGQQIAEASDARYIAPGATRELSLILTVSSEDAERYELDPSNVRLSGSFNYRTFFDLVSFEADLDMRT